MWWWLFLAVVVVVSMGLASSIIQEGVDCPGEPGLKLGGVSDLAASGEKNAAAFADVLTALEARLKVTETALKDSTVILDNMTYYDLIIDVADPTTFDVTMPDTNAVVSLVGSRPQKIKFLLPRGRDGPPGDIGIKGSDAVALLNSGLIRGAAGQDSTYGGLPEQWPKN